MNIDKKTRRYIIQIIAFAIIFFCVLQNLPAVGSAIRYILNLFMPFFLGGAIAFIFNVPMRAIEKHLFNKREKLKKLKRPVAYLITLGIIGGIITLALFVIIPEIVDTIVALTEQIPEAFTNLHQKIQDLFEKVPYLKTLAGDASLDWDSISGKIVQFLQTVSADILNTSIEAIKGIANGVVTFVIGFTFSIYVLFQKEKLGRQIKKVFHALLPEKYANKTIYICRLSYKIFSNFLSGQCVEAVILGSLFVVVMSIFRMPYAMLIGVLIGITALIPIFGAFIGCVIGMLLIAMVNPIQAIWFLILFLVLQQIEGNLIYPHVVGGAIGLPSIWVLVAVTVGGKMFGVIGMLVFIPLCSVLYTLFREYVQKRLEKKQEQSQIPASGNKPGQAEP